MDLFLAALGVFDFLVAGAAFGAGRMLSRHTHQRDREVRRG